MGKGGKVWHLKVVLARMLQLKTTTELVLLDVFSDLKVRHSHPSTVLNRETSSCK